MTIDSKRHQGNDPATEFMILDILAGILNYSDNPGQMGKYLTETIRELVGGKLIALYQHIHECTDSHRLVSLAPERYISWDGLHYFEDLCTAGHEINRSTLWTRNPEYPAIAGILEKMDCDSVVAVPLSVADHRMGILFIVQLLDNNRIREILRSFDTLSPVIALVLRNALFYETQEEIILERTHELAISEHRFRTLADLAPVGIFRIGTDTGLSFVNRKWLEITGLEHDNASHEAWYSMIHNDDREWLMKHFAETMRYRRSFSVEYRIIRSSDNRTLTVKGEGIPEYDEIGDFCGFICTLTDITDILREQEEKQKLERQLAQSQKMESIGRLAGGIAHDFNNMLSVIIGYSDIILETLSPANDFFEEISEINSAALRSKEMTAQLLAFSRKQVIDPEPLSLGGLLPQMVKTLKRLIGEDIDLEIRIGDSGWLIYSDKSQIDQLVMNLAVNARDAMPDGGKILIETENKYLDNRTCPIHPEMQPGHYVILTFSDNGKGIQKDTLPHIFEPFFTTKEKGKGTGLGLATVYGIVNQNNGLISVYSEEGFGASFRIILPAVPDHKNTVPEKKNKPLSRGTGLVLLVEDDESLRNMIKMMLTNLGYDSVEFDLPEKAVEFCVNDDRHIDCLVTDVIMPGMNGKEMALKIMETRPDIKVLFMSGYPEDIISDKGVLNKGIRFIHKPFMMKDFAERLRDVTGSENQG